MPVDSPLTRVCRDAEVFVSGLTGRTVRLNVDPDRWYVPPSLDPAALEAARADYEAYIAELIGRSTKPPADRRVDLRLTPRWQALVGPLWAATDADALAAGVDDLVRAQEQDLRADDLRVSRTYELLVVLWRHGLLAMPSWDIWPGRGMLQGFKPGPFTAALYGPLVDLITGVASQKRVLGVRPVVARFLLSFVGVTAACDVDGAALLALRPGLEDFLLRTATRQPNGSPRQYTNFAFVVLDGLLRQQQTECVGRPEVGRQLPQSYRDVVPSRRLFRIDPAFRWAVALGPRVDAWREAAAGYIASIRGASRLSNFIRALNPLLDCVAKHADWPPSPVAACEPGVTLRPDVVAAVAAAANLANDSKRRVWLPRVHAQFFDWVIAQYEREHAEGGRSLLRNPVDLTAVALPREVRNGQTFRPAIPLRFLRLMREIIEAPDEHGDPYAWPRTIMADYFAWRDVETGAFHRVWSPARAMYFLLRLDLPLRSFQVLMLDSGEGDEMVYRPGQGEGGWTANPRPYRPDGPSAPVRPPFGFARRFFDPESGTWFTGMYVNTNKTADRMRDWASLGYEIPWEHDDALRRFALLRDFQERYNPAPVPLKRHTLPDSSIRHVSPDVAARLPATFFLFRDPCHRRYPQEPLTYARVQGFWALLCHELERRLKSAGLMAPDGQPVKLVSSYERAHPDRPLGTVFDMHSLRVSGLTHLLNLGGVPMHILSAFVAGHATQLMTYYYVKPGPSQVNDALARSRRVLARADVEAREFAAYTRDQPVEVLAAAAVSNDPDGLGALAAAEPAFRVPVDYGLCPAGCTMCHVGGPVLKPGPGDKGPVYLPVPGGPRNCALCRFFVTGPAWLGGLVAKFNEAMGQLHEAAHRLRDVERAHRDLRASFGDDSYDRDAWDDPGLRRAEEAVEHQQAQLDVLVQTVARLQQLIERSKALLGARSRETDAGRALLVLGGTTDDLEVGLQSCTEYELWDRICEGAEFYPSIQATVPALRRGRLYDAMLRLNQLPPAFDGLSDAELLRVGNEFSRWLRLRLGAEDVDAVVAGRTLLADVGLLASTASMLAGVIRGPVADDAARAAPLAGPRRALRGGRAVGHVEVSP